MAEPPSARRALLFATGVTLGVGALGGLVCFLLGLPAAWMSGALIATTVIALAGVPTAVPDPVRFVCFLVLGASMGTALSPDMLAHAATWPLSMALLAVSVVAVMAGSMAFLVRVARWDAQSAFYASAPGALSTVIAMAATTPADMRKVAFSQAMRLFLLVAALPHLMGSVGHPTGTPPEVPTSAPVDVAVLLGVSLASGMLFNRLRVPGGMLVGAMAGSALLHGFGFSHAFVPSVLLVPSYVVLGASVGIRFHGTDRATLRSCLLASMGAFAVALAISVAFALLAAHLTHDDPGKLITAFSPGALETMTVLGFAMGYDPAFMSAHHLFRFAGLSVFLPLAAHLLFTIRRQGQRN
ncbi:AbrB family transcriptional regulator [Xanthobacter sp. DSM 24535]|uniref:AbrB family transcriptional regulator n=1 Tax=Roseixanthobacter psychrophilus TaxID=3119917 RepID=UPI00372B09A1